MAFDVDFQEMDIAVPGVFFADGAQGAGLDRLAAHVHAGVFVQFRHGRIEGREAGAGDAVEGQVVSTFPGRALQVGVFGTLLAQGFVVVGHRFDVDAGPAMVIERLGD